MDILRAKRYALNLLSSKMYTCKELDERLKRKGCDSETSESIVEELCNAGLMNDYTYAEMYIIDSVNLSSKGMSRIKMELRKKGISQSIIDKAADNAEVDTKQQLLEYLNVRVVGKVFQTRKDIDKLKAQLMRKGYSYREITDCLDELDIKAIGSEWD